ncbi:MAG TPA: DUF2939 domain-containing protein [Caulobacteraceae bacterium]
MALIFTVSALGGCEQVQSRYGAAEGVRAFFLAVQQKDRAAFERHVDRQALRENLRGQVAREAGGDPRIATVLQNLPASAVDQMIRPETFQLGVKRMGMSTDRVPTAAEIAVMLKMRGEDRACLGDPRVADQCLMTFERRGQDWKLVALDTAQVRVRAAARPAG